MGTVIFWIVFLGMIVILVISNLNRMKYQKQKNIEKIKNDFGRKREPVKDYVLNKANIECYSKYLREKIGDDCYIDDITWNDLNLDTVYSLINNTFSSAGEEVLYSKLRMPAYEIRKTPSFLEKALDLCHDEDKRIEISGALEFLGKVKGKSSFGILLQLFSAKQHNISKDIITDILVLLSFALIFIYPAPGVLSFLVMLVITISGYFKSKASMAEYLRAYNYVLRLIKCSDKLVDITGDSIRKTNDIFKGIGLFSFLISGKDGTSSNPLSIIMDYVRMIFHVDIISYNRNLALIINNRDLIVELYEYIGDIDAKLAVASYANSLDYYCRSVFVENTIIDAIDMYHPLTERIVANSIKTEKGVLITGSNASGKSTFLKMIGVNVIFSMAFGFALAKGFTLTKFKLFSSMALKDDILGKESYYVVETRSLKRICDAAKDKYKVLCIVDEVLRGTNTIERIASSCEILSYLAEKQTVCFVATHDIELAELLKDKYNLYYFAEKVEDGNVVFPYKISKGVSNAGNAIKLLEIMGYDEKILSGAISLVESYNKQGKWEKNN